MVIIQFIIKKLSCILYNVGTKRDWKLMYRYVFHHIFLCPIQDISTQVLAEGAYSLEFETRGHFKHLSIRFWKEDSSCKVQLARCGWVSSSPSAENTLSAQVVAAISQTPDIVCVSGCPLKI